MRKLDIPRNILCKDRHNKGQKWQGQKTEAEKINKRCKKYTEELYEKGLNDPGNHNGVVSHLKPDILECEVKQALGSITMNKASGADRIAAAPFKMML